MSVYCDCTSCCDYVSYESNIVSSKSKRILGRYLTKTHKSSNQTSSRLNTIEKKSGVITLKMLEKEIKDMYGNWSVKINDDNKIYFQHNVFTKYLCNNEEELKNAYADLNYIENERSFNKKRTRDNFDVDDSEAVLRKKIRSGEQCKICLHPLANSVDPIILIKCNHMFCLTCINSMGNEKCSFCGAKYEQKEIVPVSLYVSNSPSSIVDITTPSTSPPRESNPNLSENQLNDMFKGYLKQNLKERQNIVNNYYKMGIEIGMTLEKISSNVSNLFDHAETELINVGISEETTNNTNANQTTEVGENRLLIPATSEPSNLELLEILRTLNNKMDDLKSIVTKGKYVVRNN